MIKDSVTLVTESGLIFSRSTCSNTYFTAKLCLIPIDLNKSLSTILEESGKALIQELKLIKQITTKKERKKERNFH